MDNSSDRNKRPNALRGSSKSTARRLGRGRGSVELESLKRSLEMDESDNENVSTSASQGESSTSRPVKMARFCPDSTLSDMDDPSEFAYVRCIIINLIYIKLNNN